MSSLPWVFCDHQQARLGYCALRQRSGGRMACEVRKMTPASNSSRSRNISLHAQMPLAREGAIAGLWCLLRNI